MGSKYATLVRDTVVAARLVGPTQLTRLVADALAKGGVDELRNAYFRYKAVQALPALPTPPPPQPADGPAEPPPSEAVPAGQFPHLAPPLVLSKDGCASEPDWLAWLGALFQLRLFAPLRVAGTPPPRAKLWVCVSGPPAGGVERAVANDCALILNAASEYPVEFVTIGFERARTATVGSLRDLAGRVSDEDLVLFAGAGDEIRAETHMALKLFDAFKRELTLFDFYVRHGPGVFPVLHNGVDPVHARHCDFFFSRFCMLGRVFRRLALAGRAMSPRDLAASYFEGEAEDHARRTVHIPLPLLCAEIDVAEFRRGRDTLAAAGPAPVLAARGAEVSVVICTKDNAHLLRPLVRHLLGLDAIAEVVIVSNNTSNPHAIGLLTELQDHPRMKLLRYDRPFNFSVQCNLGARHASGEKLLFLNDDIAPSSDDWLARLLGWLDNGRRRIVGPLLLYPDSTVQHGGMYMGFMGVAGHALRHSVVQSEGLNYRLAAPRTVSVLTGAALLMPRALFEDLNGFDPLLASYLQDVDLCLRAMRSGAEIVFDPRAILFHMESVSLLPGLSNPRVGRSRGREHQYFLGRWAEMIAADPWMNPRLDPADESWRILRT